MTDAETIKYKAACLLVASDKVTVPIWREGNTFVADVRNQVTEREWRDTLYEAWKMLLQEQINKLVQTYSVLAGEE